MRSARRYALAALLGAMGGVAWAQAARPAFAPEGLLHLDVVVTDGQGQPVAGLEASDFTLLDNGKPAKIVSLQAQDGAASGTSIILLLDSLDAQSLGKVEREQAAQFLRENGGRLAHPVSVFLLDNTGFWLIDSASTDGNALASEVEHRRTKMQLIPSTEITLTDPGSGNVATLAGLDATWPDIPLTALRALARMGAAERRLPERKLLLWIGPGMGVGSGAWPDRKYVSTGHGFYPGDQACPVGMQDPRAQEYNFACPGPEQTLMGRIDWFTTLLREARIEMSTVTLGDDDPSLLRQPGFAIHGKDSPPNLPEMRERWKQYLGGAASPEQASPMFLYKNVLAVGSGGQALTLDPSQSLAQLIEARVRDAGPAYTLTFDPPAAAHANEYHAVEVKVRGEGLTAHTTTGYYDQPYFADAENQPAHPVSATQLEQVVRSAAKLPDAAATAQILALRLTERVSETREAALAAELKGDRAREAIEAIVDEAEVLSPPAGELGTAPVPDAAAQQQLLAAAAAYLEKTIPKLPDFFATRRAVQYGETPELQEAGSEEMAVPLHVTSATLATVLYREGSEVVQPEAGNARKQDRALVTYGSFGPMLLAVQGAIALPGAMTWSRWEDDAGKRLAVFAFTVSAAHSRFREMGCCLPDGEGETAFAAMPGYRGEIAVDPGSGAILRVALSTELAGFVPASQSGMMVRYGPVEIGGKTYVVPLRSVNVVRRRTVPVLWEWHDAFRTWGPYATTINEFLFTDYHMYRGEARILPN